jgi:hypothetical protein
MASYTASAYQSPEYDDKKYRQGINTDYYKNAVNQYTEQANADRSQQIAEAQKTQASALRNAYVNRLQNEQKMNRNLAMSGIRGGMTETANMNLMNQYGQARQAANTDYSNSVNQINQNIDRNIRDYRSDMDSRAEEYTQNLAQSRWQAEREDRANEVARQTEYWSTFYNNYYSHYKKKDAKKAVQNLEAQLANTTNPLDRIRIEQAISGAKARLGVIATT